MKSVFTCVMFFILIAISFGLMKKSPKGKNHTTAIICAVLSFLYFVVWVAGDNTPPMFSGLTIEQLFCWGMGIAFFRFAFYFVKEDKLAYAFIVFAISVFTCFCGLSGVQSLLKTTLLRQVLGSLNEYGNKLEGYQNTVTEMHDKLVIEQQTLSSNQLVLQKTAESNYKKQQETINRQLLQIQGMQADLVLAQSNINSQKAELNDVQYLVDNYFKNIRVESFSLKDSTNVSRIPVGEWNRYYYLFRLENSPMINSIEATFSDASSLNVPMPVENKYIKNMYNLIILPTTWKDFDSITVAIKYVADTRQTVTVKFLPTDISNYITNIDGHLAAIFNTNNSGSILFRRINK